MVSMWFILESYRILSVFLRHTRLSDFTKIIKVWEYQRLMNNKSPKSKRK